MKPINHLLPRDLDPRPREIAQRPPSSSPNTASRRHIDDPALARTMARFWERMGEAFGNRWTSQYGLVGESAFHTWAEALAGVNPQLIAQGLRKCVLPEFQDLESNRGSGWPPTLSEFLVFCQDANQPINASHRIWREDRRLEKKPTPEQIEQAEQARAELRAAKRSLMGQETKTA